MAKKDTPKQIVKKLSTALSQPNSQSPVPAAPKKRGSGNAGRSGL